MCVQRGGVGVCHSVVCAAVQQQCVALGVQLYV